MMFSQHISCTRYLAPWIGVLLQTTFSFLLQLTRPHAAYKSLLCMHYLVRPVARAGGVQGVSIEPTKWTDCYATCSCKSKKKSQCCVMLGHGKQYQCSKKNVRRALANDQKWWPKMVIINISLGSRVCLAAVKPLCGVTWHFQTRPNPPLYKAGYRLVIL